MTTRAFNPLAILALTGSDASYRLGDTPDQSPLRSLGDSKFNDEVGFPEALRLSLSALDGSFAENQISGTVSTPRGPENVAEFSNWRLVELINRPNLGFGASIYQLEGQNEYVVALRGTDGPDLKDWLQNASYAVPAWREYQQTIFDYLLTEKANGIPAVGTVHFVGQSLGGGLAQYAAYEFVRRAKEEAQKDDPQYTYDASRVSLTTFNAFAGAQGLVELYGVQTPGGFDPTLLTGVQTAHFAIDNDLVHRLGADVDYRIEFVGEDAKLVPYVKPGYGHLNGEGNTYLLGFKRFDSGVPVPGGQGFLGLVDSHRIESGFYAGFANYGVSFAPNAFLEPESYEYIDASGSQVVASRFSQLFVGQNAKLTDFGAGARLALGLASGVLLGNPVQTAALTNEVIDSLYRSGDISPVGQVALKFVNFALVPATLLVPALNVARGVFIALDLLGKLSAEDKTQAVQLLNSTFTPQTPLPTAVPPSTPGESDAVKALRYEWMGLGLAAKLAPEQRAAFVNDPGKLAIVDLLARTSLDPSQVAETLLTESDWLGKTLALIQTAAADAGLSRIEIVDLDIGLLRELSNQIAAYGAVDPTVSAMLASAQEEFAEAELAEALANAQRHYRAKYVDAGDAFGDSALDFVEYQPIHDALVAAMADPEFAEIRDLFKRVAGTADHAAQDIVIAGGHGANPFGAAGFDPEGAPIPTGSVAEGHSRAYTVYLPYPAGAGGQHVTLKLEGNGVNEVQSIWAGEQVDIEADGSFRLLVREGGREAGFSLVFDEEFDGQSQVALSAALVDANGQATHESRVELNLTLELGQRVEERPVQVLTGDSGGMPFRDLLLGSAGPDRIDGGAERDVIGGGAAGDLLIGGPGADVVVGSGDEPDEGGSSFRRLEEGDDTLYAEEEVDVEAFIESSRTATGTGVRGDWLTAGRGEDVVVGSHANDALFGGGGDDLIVGGAGDDVLDGDDHYYPGGNRGGGNRISFLDTWLDWTISETANPFVWIYDQVESYDYSRPIAGADRIYGGAGRDRIAGLGGDDTLLGEGDDDILLGGDGDDVILGGAGDDQITGESSGDGLADNLGTVTPGADFLDGGDGDDSIQGEHLGDVLYGGAGNDELWGDARYTLPVAYHGDDFLDGGDGDDELIGQGGADTLFGGAGDDLLFGDDDTIPESAHGDDFLDGGEGADFLRGYGGDDTLIGGAGDDVLLAEAGADHLDGGLGKDSLDGGAGDDELRGGSEADELAGGEGADFLDGEAGDDTLDGGAGDDDLYGAAGLDALTGGDGSDRLFGEAGDDVLSAEAGDDLLEGGTGKDELIGGEGNDTFRLSLGDGEDLIVDALGANAIEFGPGIAAGDLEIEHYQGADGAGYLRIAYGLPGDVVTINSGLLGAIRRFRFPDGTELTMADLLGEEDLPAEVFGSERDDSMFGGSADNVLDGGAGDDELVGGAGDDLLMGGIGADSLDGGDGADSLDGGPGDDTLLGGAGEDIYRVRWGMGEDTIVETDAGSNVLTLDAGMGYEDLSARRAGDDLVLSIRGTGDGATIAGFYAGTGEWRIDDATDQSKAMATFLTEDAARAAAARSAEEAIGEYRARVRSLVYSTLGSEGYSAGTDGTLAKVDTVISPFSIDTTASTARFVVAAPTAGEGSVARRSAGYESSVQTTYSQREIEFVSVQPGTRAYNPPGVSYSPVITTRFVPRPVSTTFNVFGQPPAGSKKVGGNSEFLGTWIPIQETTWSPAGGRVPGLPAGRITVTDSFSTRDETIRQEDVSGGTGADGVSTVGFSVADAGAGDDTLTGGGTGGSRWRNFEDYTFTFTLRPLDPRNLGSLFYGNLGDDIVGGTGQDDYLLGGDGSDILDGGHGGDTYRVFLDETGVDLVADSGYVIIDSEGGWSRYKEWLLTSYGFRAYDNPQAALYEYAQTHDIRTRPNDFASIQTLAAAHVLERDVVEFGAGISASDLTVSWGEYLYLRQGQTSFPGDFATIHATLDIFWRPDAGVRILVPHSVNEGTFDPFRDVEYGLGAGIEAFRFADGTSLSMVQMAALAGPTPNLDPHLEDNVQNQAPIVSSPIADQQAPEDSAWRLSVASAFTDPDPGDVLSFSAMLAEGGALPAWLTFDGGTGALAGTPTQADVGNYEIRVTTRDGSGLSALDAFLLTVTNTNDAPIVANPIGNVTTPEDAPFDFAVPAATFADVDPGDSLSFGATLATGASLPSWLGFDAATARFSGLPGNAEVGVYSIRLTATDISGVAATDIFELRVANVNDAPVVNGALDAAAVQEGQPLAYALPTGLFSDVDAGDTLAYALEALNGAAAPSWLALDGAGSSLTGTAPLGDAGTEYIVIKATDLGGLAARAELRIDITAAPAVDAQGTQGDDVLTGTSSGDTLGGRGGDDALFGYAGDDLLRGGSGNDVIQGGSGADVLRAGGGQNLLEGGAGDDRLYGGAGASVLIGGAGNDVIRAGRGSDVIVFNRGDGNDSVYADGAQDNSLSLGGGIRYDDLALRRAGRDLVLDAGAGDSITFKNWYANNARPSLLNLQLVSEAMADFDASSTDPLLSKKVQRFDFQGVVTAFDAMQAANPGVSTWAISSALTQFLLASSDTAALGGDLAYHYGKRGTLAGIGLQAAQEVIGSRALGVSGQALRPFEGLQEGMVRLG